MDVVRHNHELMNGKFIRIAILKDRAQQQVRHFRSLEEVLVHIGGCRDEVRLCHVSPAKAGFSSKMLLPRGPEGPHYPNGMPIYATLKRRTTRATSRNSLPPCVDTVSSVR
jgi:hypothetical protein